MPSFYCPELTEYLKQTILTGDEFHHLTHVLRHKQGDTVKLNSGKGNIARGTIVSIDKKQAVIDINEIQFTKPNSIPFAIAFSLLRNKNDEWLVEKVTELGVKDLFPITTQFSVRNPSINTLSRFRNAALSAIKQCDNPYLPRISEVLALKKAILYIKEKGYTPVVASENVPDMWLDNLKSNVSYCVIIGPEGGFSPDEFIFLKNLGVEEITLSNLILRAETAAIAVAAQMNLKRK